MKNVVIGTSINFKENDLKNFILSFREVNKNDDIILFIDDHSLTEFLSKYNVISHVCDFYKFIDTPIHNSRYIKCLDFLTSCKTYKNILLADTKDVIFQHNPFDNLPEEYLYFFNEDAGTKIKDDYFYNSWWIFAAYNQNILSQIAENNIICSGTILGSYNEILKLLNHIQQELFKIKKEKFETFKNTILDQAIVNVIGYLDNFQYKNFEIKSNGNIVATLGATLGDKNVKLPDSFDLKSIDTKYLTMPPSQDVVLMKEHHILVNNLTPSIIHQYDRHSTLKDIFNRKYPL